MRSQKVEVAVPNIIRGQFEEMCKRAQMRSLGRWFLYLGLKELGAEKRIEVDRMIANSDPDEQDELIELVLDFPSQRHEMREVLLQLRRQLGKGKNQRDGK